MAIFMSQIKFQCSSCSECCRRIGKLTKEQRVKLDFPYEPKADGSCEKLTDDGKCSVYDNRPSICSVERTFEKFHAPKGRTKKDVYLQENKICNSMIKQAKLDEKYLIDLEYYTKFH